MVHPYLATRSVPGDLGDARFNLYILEHTFLWISEPNRSYMSPGIFYPYPGAMFFSDTHVGSVLVYILFRAVGISEFTSFTLWLFTGYLLTFVASHYALLRFGFKPLAAVTAAVIFSFSLPSLAQLGHAQLVYRFAVPLAFLSLWRYLRAGRVTDAASLAIWTSLQMLCSVYVGIFLILTLGVFGFWSLVLNRKLHPLSAVLRRSLEDARFVVSNRSIRHWTGPMVAALLAVAVAVLLGTYQIWSVAYGLGKKWLEISEMVPRLQSYFQMQGLPYWNFIYRKVVTAVLPMANEHNLFMGLGALGLFLLGAAAAISQTEPRRRKNLAKTALLVLATLLVLVTMFENQTFYFFLTYVPGLSAIRAVARISIVLMFPVSLVIAWGVHALLRSPAKGARLAMLWILLAISVLEIGMFRQPSFPISEAETRIVAIVSEARRKSVGIENPILFVMGGNEAPYLVHLDAMFAAQQLGWPTANGYSSNDVPGYEYKSTCDAPARQIAAYENWQRAHPVGPELSVKDFKRRLVLVGSKAC